MKICAGIVLYNPDVAKLNENIMAIAPQVDEVILVDNTPGGVSGNIVKYENIHVIHNKKNYGIGKALNQICRFADRRGYGWYITLDQDSVCDRELVEQYKRYLDNHIGQLTCNITDRHLGRIEKYAYKTDVIEDIESCITSGCINNVKAVKRIGGYDESMFIDGVDIDISLRLKQKGYKLLRLNYDGLIHSLGDGKQINILGKKLSFTRHAPWRNYYMRRNFIYIARKYYKGLEKYKKVFRQIVYGIGTILMEDKKLERLKFNTKGVIEGIRRPIK